MTAATMDVGFIAALPKDPPKPPSCLSKLATKVCDFIKSRWVFISLVGLAMAGIASYLAAVFLGLALAPSIACGSVVGVLSALVTRHLTPEQAKALRISTLNFIKVWSDPFEFDSDCGELINGIRDEVNALLIGKATGKKEPSDEEIQADVDYGPKTNRVLTQELWTHVLEKANDANTKAGKEIINIGRLTAAKDFFAQFPKANLFYFLKNCPPSFLGMDLQIRRAADAAEKDFDWPIVSSSAPIPGKTKLESKKAIADRLMTAEAIACATGAKEEQVKRKKNDPEVVAKLDKGYKAATAALAKCLGVKKVNQNVFAPLQNPEGELLFCLFYQGMMTDLLHEADMIDKANQAKKEFATGIGNRAERAQFFAQRFADNGSDVVCVQECSKELVDAMAERGYMSTYRNDETGKPRSRDGSVIFLSKKTFKRDFVVFTPYPEDPEGKVVSVSPERIDGWETPVITCAHGSANNVNILLQQITRSTEKARRLGKKHIIGMDANPKFAADRTKLGEHLKSLGLKATNVVRSVVKTRKFTVQHDKTDEEVDAEKDFIATDEAATMTNQMVENQAYQISSEKRQPNVDNPSDHSSVTVDVA